MKGFFQRDREPTLAAGGIVLRNDGVPQVALVKLRKDKAWVLPKGKLKPKEDALAAAKREVLEETGHDVSVHEFLGSMSHEAGRGNLKVVQFWRMQAVSGPVRPLTRDVKAVQWLPLDEAVKKLTHSREQMFLANVKSTVLQAAERSGRTAPLAPPVQPAVDDLVSATAGSARKGLVEQMRSWVRRMALTPPRKAR